MNKLHFYYILSSWYEYDENNGFDFSSTVQQQKKKLYVCAVFFNFEWMLLSLNLILYGRKDERVCANFLPYILLLIVDTSEFFIVFL